jgi:hypothetical protein
MAFASIRLAALLALAAPAAGFAQAVPDLGEQVTQSEQLTRDIEQATLGRDRDPDAGQEVDGESGIYVLTVNRIFQLSASAGTGWTDNPERTADDLGSSAFGDFALSAGIATRLGGKVDFGLFANAAGREFYESGRPSSRSTSATVSVGVPVVGPVYASAIGFGGFSFDSDFENPTGFYGASGSLSATMRIADRLAVRPSIGATRQWSEIAENDSSQVAAAVDVLFAITPEVSASVRGTVYRRWYDDFYEDVTFVARRDTNVGIAASLAWRPTDGVAVVATLAWEDQDSRFFLADYQVFEGVAGLSLRLRF